MLYTHKKYKINIIIVIFYYYYYDDEINNKKLLNKENIRKDVKALNAQWGLGGGMEYYFSESNAFTIGVYYHQGFFDITSKRPTNDGKEINHTIALKVGILF